MERMPSTRIEKANGRQAIEPGVSDPLNESCAVAICFFAQRLHLLCRRPEIRRVGCKHIIELARDRLHELAADSGSEGFEAGGVHRELKIARAIMALRVVPSWPLVHRVQTARR